MAKRTNYCCPTLGKIFNNFTCCCCIILISLHLQFSPIFATDAEVSSALNVTSTPETNATFLTPVAEALVRYRRHPLTIVKHIIRPKRMKVKRVKRPKIKYSFAEPPPHIYYKSSSHKTPVIKSKPMFDASIFEDISHINVASSDFDAPPSSYEAQSMDLDLYSSFEAPAENHYKISKKPSYKYAEPEVTFKGHAEIPTYSYEAPKKVIRKPHTKYGLPTDFGYSTDFEKPSGNKFSSYESIKTVESPKYNYPSYDFDQPSDHSLSSYEHTKTAESPKYHAPIEVAEQPQYHAPPSYETSKEVENHSYFRPEEDKYSYIKSAEKPRIPATTYGVPDMPIPSSNFDNYNKYSVFEHQPTSYENFESIKSNQHHFAEPPSDHHEQNVQIMYSPSYEINIPSKDEQSHSGYETHPQQYESPTDHHSHSSPHQESSDTHQPPSYEPAPPQDLPINHNHKHPTYDYTKSSYEVPIYDPIPFDSSNNQEHEIYPPQTYGKTSWKDVTPEYVAEPNNISERRPIHAVQSQHIESGERPTGDTHSSGTRSTTDVIPPRLQRTHKRNRSKGSTPSTSTIHILDVPELRQAFENEKRQRQQPSQSISQEKNPPQHTVDNVHNESNKVPSTSNNRWNPMKIRTPPMIAPTSPPAASLNHYQYKGNINRPQRTRPTTTTQAPSTAPVTPKVQIVSIEKSRSKSYYDGILQTPKIYNHNLYRNRYKTSQPSTTTSTTTPAPQSVLQGKDRFSKRTTKNIFDTTVFKSPLNDKDVYRNLPKNHKLF